MSATIVLVLALMALWASPVSDPQRDVTTVERMKQREEYLQEQMTRLLQEIEQSSSVKEPPLHWVVLERLFYTLGGGLVVFPPLWCVTRIMNLVCDCCTEQESASSEEEEDKDNDEENEEEHEEEEEEEEANDDEEDNAEDDEEELNGAPNGIESLAVSTPSPTQGLPDTCKVLRKLVGDLLGICQALWKNSLLQMYPLDEMDGLGEKWRVQENRIDYRLVVYLRPPPGHSFIVEQDTTGQLPARPPRVRVVLECVCSMGQLLGESLCFLHHPDTKLPRDQSSFFLRTLCTGSYLDMEKVTCQFQQLVRSAWLLLPESQRCQLTVLPSSCSCRFQLTGSSGMTFFTEIMFAMDPGS